MDGIHPFSLYKKVQGNLQLRWLNHLTMVWYSRYTTLSWMECLWEIFQTTWISLAQIEISKHLQQYWPAKKLGKYACQCLIPSTLVLATLNLTYFLPYHCSYTNALSNNWYLAITFSLPLFLSSNFCKREECAMPTLAGTLCSQACPNRQYSSIKLFQFGPDKTKLRVGGELTSLVFFFPKSVEFIAAEFVPLVWAVTIGLFHIGHQVFW